MPTRRNVLRSAASLPIAWQALSLSAPKAVAAKTGPLRYLQIGTGHAHAGKLEVYAESAEWEVVGIVEEDPELRKAAEKSPLYRRFPMLGLEEALKTPDLRVVGVETRVRDLLRYARAAVDAGCHVHLDKPAGLLMAAYRDLMKEADAKGLVVQMGFMYRFNPAVQLLRRMLEAGWLGGEIFETHAVMSKVIPRRITVRISTSFRGGTMFELGCHIIDLTVSVLGKPQRVVPFPRRSLDLPDDTLVDNMLAVLEYPKATATVRTTGLEVEGGSRRHFTVCGTGGTFHIQPLDKPTVTLSLAEERRFSGKGSVSFRKAPARSLSTFRIAAMSVTPPSWPPSSVARNQSVPSSHDLTVQETVLAAAGMGG